MNDVKSLDQVMEALGKAGKAASRVVAAASSQTKRRAIKVAAEAIRTQAPQILAANAADMKAAEAAGLTKAKLDRLLLTPDRVEAMAAGLEQVAALDDPVGKTLAAWDRPNGLTIRRVSVPLGVVAVVFESRPNVTADAAALCLMAGNATILRGGSDSFNSGAAILSAFHIGLEQAGLPTTAVQAVPTTDREAVGILLRMLTYIDVIVPRGGKSLVERVQNEARVPVFSHLDGINHTYIDASADLDMAQKICVNAKMRRTGICGAMETLLVHKDVAPALVPPLVAKLRDLGCEIRGDRATAALASGIVPATQEDWETEYLDSILSVSIVESLDGAIDHIARFGSQHTEAIVAEDHEVAATFLARVDAAIVMHNTSSQFADGGEFGMGAEIGISTGRMHARGPVGASQLTSYKYIVSGSGQIRP